MTVFPQFFITEKETSYRLVAAIAGKKRLARTCTTMRIPEQCALHVAVAMLASEMILSKYEKERLPGGLQRLDEAKLQDLAKQVREDYARMKAALETTAEGKGSVLALQKDAKQEQQQRQEAIKKRQQEQQEQEHKSSGKRKRRAEKQDADDFEGEGGGEKEKEAQQLQQQEQQQQEWESEGKLPWQKRWVQSHNGYGAFLGNIGAAIAMRRKQSSK